MQVNRALTAAEIASRVARKNATTRDLSNLLWMILDKGIGWKCATCWLRPAKRQG